ncbi:MAG: hypothetical protein ACR2NN_04735 [Bryobacteraceae bacterium]
MLVSAVFENIEAVSLRRFSPPRQMPLWVWMLILFDPVTPRGIARFLPGHIVTKAKDAVE